MISGNDILIETDFSEEVAEQILKRIQSSWPEFLIEDAASDDTIEFSIPFFTRLPQEFFVYKNNAAKQLWDDLGACDENTNTMVHVIIQTGSVSIIVDNPGDAACRDVIEASRSFARELASSRIEVAA